MVGGTSPGKGGRTEIGLPVFNTVAEVGVAWVGVAGVGVTDGFGRGGRGKVGVAGVGMTEMGVASVELSFQHIYCL